MNIFNLPKFEDEEKDRKLKISFYVILIIILGFFLILIER